MPFALLMLFEFLAAMALAYAVTKLLMARKRAMPELTGVARIKHRRGFTLCRIGNTNSSAWSLDLLERETALPVVGESVLVEAPTRGGTALFRSTVLVSDGETLCLTAPDAIYPRERRKAPRFSHLEDLKVKVDGEPALALDLSGSGARLRVFHMPPKGTRVNVRIGSSVELFGWVVEAERFEDGPVIRVHFEEFLHPQFLDHLAGVDDPVTTLT